MDKTSENKDFIEVKRQVKTFKIRRYCQCGGEFIFKYCEYGVVYKFHHSCKECGKETWFDDRYPAINHEEVKEGVAVCPR